eukprot:3293538-Amphidinium_carterae.1
MGPCHGLLPPQARLFPNHETFDTEAQQDSRRQHELSAQGLWSATFATLRTRKARSAPKTHPVWRITLPFTALERLLGHIVLQFSLVLACCFLTSSIFWLLTTLSVVRCWVLRNSFLKEDLIRGWCKEKAGIDPSSLSLQFSWYKAVNCSCPQRSGNKAPALGVRDLRLKWHPC